MTMQIAKFSQMVSAYKDKMFRYAFNIVGSRFAAEDVVQEAMIKIWKKREQFAEIENKEAWCVTITRNLAIDKVRAGKKRRAGDITEYHHISDQSPSPDVQLEQKDALATVALLLDSLPPQQKEIITLRDVEGYTYQEIADILEVSVDQVKVSLHRARKSLRSKLVGLRGKI